MRNLKKSILSILAAGIMAFSFTACGTNNDSISSTKTTAAATVVNREGNKITIPDSLSKIVSTEPSITEILIGLGLKDKIIATDKNSADTGVDAKIATIDTMNMNIEQIVALKPEVVFIDGMSTVGSDDPYAALKDAGITVLFIPTVNSLQDIMDDITFISTYTKTADKGSEMVGNIKSTIEDLKTIGDKITEKKTVYFEVSAAPSCYSFGKGTYLNEIIELVGAKNVFSDKESWISVTEENVISANPDAIITNVKYDGYDYKEISTRPGWDATNAVKNKAIVQVSPNLTSRPSQNVVNGMKEIAMAIYPDQYK